MLLGWKARQLEQELQLGPEDVIGDGMALVDASAWLQQL